jgi:D-3-phosphoglycerate dehydrogenase / 2-oxoglutarate reductase
VSRVLVTEKIADSGLDRLRQAGHEVDVQLDFTPESLLELVEGAHALIIRSATQVTADVLAAGSDLVVVGRAGIGLDNVDTEAATQQGVMVVNAPQSNVLSAAEHTMALILAQARNIAPAHAALVEGRWERSKWEGIELSDKVLGIVGLGRIGRLVAQRAHAFGMRLVAYDPFVTPERARQMNVEVLDLDDLLATADFLTLHVAKTPDTIGMIGVEALKKVKPGIRIVNVARGGIVDEQALADAIEDGRVGGAAIDVFAEEPTTESPLFGLPGVVVTPHLGASTREAQDKAGATIAEQVGLALAGDFVPFAVNVSAAEASETVRPFLPLAERLGGLFAALLPELPDELRVEYQGSLADYDTRILTLSVQKGFFGRLTDEPVSYVNAPAVAETKGMAVHESKTSTTQDYVNLITLRGGGRSMAGTLAGLQSKPRIVMVDDHAVDVPPSDHMLVVRNDDSPGVIGFVGTVLGEAGVNIADMDVGQSPDGHAALMVVALSTEVPESVQDQLRADARIKLVRSLG